MGNKRAFDQLVRQYQSPVRRFLLSLTLGNEALSDDLSQETFIKAYTHIGQYRGTSSFLTWLTRIAYNAYYDYKRKEDSGWWIVDGGEKREERGEIGERIPCSVASSTCEVNSISMDINQALGLLKEDERACITLQLIDGYAIDEIAAITKMPAGTVKSHLKRGKDKLANYLRQNGYDG